MPDKTSRTENLNIESKQLSGATLLEALKRIASHLNHTGLETAIDLADAVAISTSTEERLRVRVLAQLYVRKAQLGDGSDALQHMRSIESPTLRVISALSIVQYLNEKSRIMIITDAEKVFREEEDYFERASICDLLLCYRTLSLTRFKIDS